MEQKSGAWLPCCCVCICVCVCPCGPNLMRQRSLIRMERINQGKCAASQMFVSVCVCVFLNACVWVRERERVRQWQKVMEKKGFGGGKQAFARCGDPEFNSWQNAESGFGLSSHKWTSGLPLGIPFSNAEMCGELRHWQAGFEKLSVSNVGKDWSDCHNGKIHLVNKTSHFIWSHH